MLSTKFRLEVWKGDWGLSSVDPECLRVIAYARLSESPVALTINSAPWNVSGGVYPVLHAPSGPVVGADSIIRFLRNEGFLCPHEKSQMTTYEEADAYALETYLKASVLPLLEYLWWVDEDVFRRITVPWYSKELSLYGQFVWVHNQRKRISGRLLVTPDALLTDANLSHVRKNVIRKAKRCLEDLAVRLSDKTFIFGLK